MAQTIKLRRSATAGATPTTSQLELGEVAINTYDGKMYIKKSVGGTESIVELGAGLTPADAILEEYLYTATASQTAFSGNDDNSDFLSYTAGALQVFLNGILLDPETDYTATNGATITLTAAAAVNDYLQIFAFKKKIGNGNVSVDTFSGNNSTTAYTLSLDPGDENNTRVFIDGVYQSKSNYTVSGTTLTFSSAPPSGTSIEVEIGNRVVSLDTLSDLDLPDNVKLRLGTSQDLEIYHDASDSLINDNGTGSLKLQTGGSTKLEITSSGVDVTGDIAVSGTVDGVDIAARDAVLTSTTTTAGAALPRTGGAMTGAITTNSTFDGRDVATDGAKLDGIEAGATADQTQSEINALGITATGLSGTPAISVANITTTGELRGPASFTIDPAAIGDNTGTVIIKGNLQVDGATTTINSTTLTVDDLNLTLASGAANGTAADGAGITIDGASATLTYNSTGDSWDFNKNVDVSGSVTASGPIILTAGALAAAGNAGLSHRSTDNKVYLQAGTGGFNILDDQQNTHFFIDSAGAATFSGTVTADGLNVPDGEYLRFNTNGLTLRTNANNAYIVENSGGKLAIQASNLELSNTAGTQTYAYFSDGGSSQIFYNNNKKLETTNTGIDVTGTVTADGLVVEAASGNSTITLKDASGSPNISFTDVADTVQWQIYSTMGGVAGLDPLVFYSSAGERMRIDASGNVGIGVVPESWYTGGSMRALQIGGNTGVMSLFGTRAIFASNYYLKSGTGADTYINTDEATQYYQEAGTHIWKYAPSGTADTTISWSEAMRIDASGKLLVGKTSAGDYVTGVEMQPAGAILSYRTTNVASIFGRTNDGEITRFTSAGAVVGNIGVEGGDLTIGTGDTGLQFRDASDAIRPFNISTNAARDANIDLGRSSERFRDLYLSGTASMAALEPGVVTISSGSYFIGNATNGYRFNNAADTSNLMILRDNGDLLVGTTSAYGTTGTTINAAGLVYSSADGDRAGQFDRTGITDGEIVRFSKAGSTVGSIGVAAGPVAYIVLNDATSDNVAALKGASGAILPSTNAGADKNGTMNLGSPGARFESLYLSEGIQSAGGSTFTSVTPMSFNKAGSDTYTKTVLYDSQNNTANNVFSGLTLEMGRLTNSGTATPRTFTISDRGATNRWCFSQYGLSFNPTNSVASAAESLDDYEEGTFTSTLDNEANITNISSSATIRYRKVGGLVHIEFDFSGSFTNNTSEARFRFTVPFNFATTTPSAVGIAVVVMSGTFNQNRFTNAQVFQGTTANSSTYIYISASQIPYSGAFTGRATLTYAA